MDKESQLIWEAYLSEASNLEAYEDDALSGTWAAIINGKEYSGIVRDLINDTQHIDQVDYPVAQLDKFGLFKFTKDGLTIPQNEDASANIDGKWIKYTDLTPQQKLNELDQRLGKGIGAVRQRQRYQKELKKASS